MQRECEEPGGFPASVQRRQEDQQDGHGQERDDCATDSFQLEKLDCSMWLAQQLVMFDRRGITLKDVIRMVTTYEGTYSPNLSRLLQAADRKVSGRSGNSERLILDNVTVFGMKYTQVVATECALRLHKMFVKAGHIPRPPDKRSRLQLSFGTTVPTDFFSENQDWLRFAGGLILAFGSGERKFTHRIWAVGK